ncbi:N-acetylmuramoyl-L-alanine amidase [Blastococcus sp. SYSU DS0510]
MRRVIAGTTAFVALTGTLLVLPVYASPLPEAEPVETSIDTVELGSADAPTSVADVAQAEDIVPELVGEVAGDAGPGAQPVAAEDPVLTFARSRGEEFSAVGVTWRVDEEASDVTVRLRSRAVGGGWGEWAELQADDVEQSPSAETADVRAGTAPYWTGPSSGVEVQVTAAGGEQPRDVQVELIDPGTSEADTALGASDAVGQAHAASAMPVVHSRAQWGADESIRFWDPEYAPTIKAATLHHTADANGYTADQVPAIMRSIYAYHTKSRGWGDIGYNVIVDRFGRIFEGRHGGLSSTVVGAHAGGFNTGTFGVSMLGDYSKVDTPQAMLDSVAAIIAWKLDLYGVDPKGTTQLTSGGGTSRFPAGQVVTVPTVFAHRDVTNTACPGQYAYNRMGQLRDMVGGRIGRSPGGSPLGGLESLQLDGAVLSFSGWTFDPDFPTGSIAVGIEVGGRRVVTATADRFRPDVAAVHPQAGPGHGFAGSLSLTRGRHQVCVVLLNAPPSGADVWTRCQYVTVATDPAPGKDPVGNLEAATISGRTVSLRGWAVDPDALTAALSVHVYVNGSAVGAVTAGLDRPDVAAAIRDAGPAHGFQASFESPGPGRHKVCVYAINQNAGTTNPELGCRTVDAPAGPWAPRGSLDTASASGRTVTVTGWALDDDTPQEASVIHLHVDGVPAKALRADGRRDDVAAAFPAAGSRHGYVATLDLAPGARSVCAYALNTGYGTVNTQLGCRSVSVAASAWNPVGSLDGVDAGTHGVAVHGWAWDPDRGAGATSVHVYVDGRWGAAITAAETRADVAAAVPAAGPAHGYAITLPLGSGQHQVCAYAINTGHGSTNPLLGCRTVQV